MFTGCVVSFSSSKAVIITCKGRTREGRTPVQRRKAMFLVATAFFSGINGNNRSFGLSA